MSLTNALESTRLSLHHIGKLIYSQSTELLNPAMNRGLPPSLAATDPSLNYCGKGIDIATASYVSELGWLAGPVSTHVQSAEMHNQAVKLGHILFFVIKEVSEISNASSSLALISARATITSLDVLSMLMSSYLYILCQALDLRALQSELTSGLISIVKSELAKSFTNLIPFSDFSSITEEVTKVMRETLDKTSTMDAEKRMKKLAGASSEILLRFFTNVDPIHAASAFKAISSFQTSFVSQATGLLTRLRKEFLTGARGPAPASCYLNKTRPMYEFVRIELDIKMHGNENLSGFKNGLGVEDVSIGQNVSKIYEVRISIFFTKSAGLYDRFLLFLGYERWKVTKRRCRYVSVRRNVGGCTNCVLLLNMKSDNVLIVGAGCFGLSTAYHLLSRGFSNVTILERSAVIPAPDAASRDLNKSIFAVTAPS
jgi:phenylalanine ammonia-lyase